MRPYVATIIKPLIAILAVLPAVAPADSEIRKYQEQARQAIANAVDVHHRSQVIASEYRKLYADNPKLTYAKAAALAGTMISRFIGLDYPLISDDVQAMQGVAAAGNLAIYSDVMWPLRAYTDGGMELIRAARATIHPTMYEAIEKIDAGKIHEGNLLLVAHEQRNILQPVLDPHADLVARQSRLGWVTFGTITLVGSTLYGPPRPPTDPGFGDLNARLPWATEGFLWAEGLTDAQVNGILTPLSDAARSHLPALFPPGIPVPGRVVTSPLFGSDTAPSAPGTGGVDFTAVELRYLAERPTAAGTSTVAYAVRAPGTTATPEELVAGVGASRDALLTWLALPPQSFWVNLNPSEPDRVIDRELARTAAGRILLEADLQMKKTVASLIHPDTATGAEFWETLYAVGSGDQVCFSARQWIVPGHVRVYATDEELFILDAPLEVKLESDALVGTSGTTACPPSPASDAMEAMFRQTILPKVTEAVNTAPEYGPLRTVFAARIAAEWYASIHRPKAESFAPVLGSGSVTGWEAQDGWSPQTVFDDYVRSVQQGEFNITRQQVTGNVIETRTYLYGGVDLIEVALDVVDLAQLLAENRGVVGDLADSLFAAKGWRDQAGGVWVGEAFGGPAGGPAPPGAGPAEGEPDGPEVTPFPEELDGVFGGAVRWVLPVLLGIVIVGAVTTGVLLHRRRSGARW